jgi:adenylate kinase
VNVSISKSQANYTMLKRQPAILLLGPTGAGKSPLGDYLEKVGFNGKRCFHFDFGRSMREVARGVYNVNGLTDMDITFVSSVLKGGALLEKNRFYIAERIMNHFAHQSEMGIDHYLVLNGLPRHIEQAKDVDRVVDVHYLFYLRCTPEVVGQRIGINAGGDRMGRDDDSTAEIEQKLQLFQKRTIPLLDHYESQEVVVKRIDINVQTTPKQILGSLTK